MWKQRLIALIAAGILKLLFLTIRVKLEDRNGFATNPPDFPVIFTFWHNRILAITTTFKKFYPTSSRHGVTVLTSPSRDGEILARVVAAFGMRSVRGSSSRRGSRALRELNQLIKAKEDLAITPDGPRGPKYTLGPGPVFLAALTGARILPVHARFSRCWRMKTWDEFCIPKPFSTIYVIADHYIAVPRDLSESEFEDERKRIETLLKNEAH